MTDLSANRFPEYFQALWEQQPFAWQTELARRALSLDNAPWPQAIALPTAAGKTACIDIAVFALAASVQKDGAVVRCRAPRRIFFVVDRRVIVDETYERACELARRLREAEDGVLKEVADNLRQIAYGRSDGEWSKEEPLLPFQLRGGMYRSEAWARSPLQPIVVASTVDQVGSRLLFRGYGRGPGMWPVFAGLVGNDSLIFLDEAHCARPFLETLQAVARYRKVAEEPIPASFHPVVLSATPPMGLKDVFEDKSNESTDSNHPLGRRQLARKPALLVPPVKASGKSANEIFAEALAENAVSLAGGAPVATVVFANRVATARTTHELLLSKNLDAVLLTGRMRPFDKDDTVNQRLRELSSRKSETRKLDHPVFVIATQTLEVGADLDFDCLVTECASLDALRQRFGRLNRRGRAIDARAAILIREDQSKDSNDDPVYGSALAETWAWLLEKGEKQRTVDFGVAYLNPLLPNDESLAVLNAPSQSAPVLLPAHLDFLAQTSPIPAPSPEVALFLHGPGRASADVQVCWRSDIELDDEESEKSALDVLTQCPPASAECLPVPIWLMRRWLTGATDGDSSTDIEGERSPNEDLREYTQDRRPVIRWRSRDDAKRINDPDELRPGDVVVVPARYDNWKTLGDLAPVGEEVVFDWGDRAYRMMRARAILRLHPNLIRKWPIAENIRQELVAIASDAPQRLEEDADALASDLKDILREIAAADLTGPWLWLREVAESLTKESVAKLIRNILPHPFGGVIVRGARRFPVRMGFADVFTDEDDAAASGTVPVTLSEHLPGVAGFARRFAEATSLPKSYVETIELSGLLHDLGKADLRFQALLRNGQRFVAGELLAKSGDVPQSRSAFRRVRELVGYPEGGRHELLSVRLVESADDMLPESKALRELVLHLIASHHGYCRPFAPVVQDSCPIEVSFELLGRNWSHSSVTNLEQLDSGVSQRFWRLTRRHGWWGLSWLEALLRLADHRRSEAERMLKEKDDV